MVDISKLSPGVNPPKDVNVVIEVPMGSQPVKYEVDKDTGAIFVDRFLHTAMFYPCNYGFIPKTLAGDGDPVDVLVITQYPIIPGAVIRSRPVGALVMRDEAGQDEKILAVPVGDLHPYYDNINEAAELRTVLREQITHFFTHYKDLEKNKEVEVGGWIDAAAAEKLILEGIKNYKD